MSFLSLDTCLFCLSANHLIHWAFFLDSKCFSFLIFKNGETCITLKNVKKKNIEITSQRWNSATPQTKGITRPDNHLWPPFPRNIIQLDKLVTLHFYQQMAHSFGMDKRVTSGGLSVSCSAPVLMEMGRLKGVLSGLLQVCVQVKVLSYRDCWSAVSGCLRGGK